MPYLNIVTNQSIEDEPAFLKAVTQTVAKASGKPATYVMISLESKTSMMMGGSSAPTAFLDYRALGLPSDHTEFSTILCTLINEQLGISGDRIYISMNDSERQNWGWNYETF